MVACRDWNRKKLGKIYLYFADHTSSLRMIIVFIIFIISLNSSEFISIVAVNIKLKKERDVGRNSWESFLSLKLKFDSIFHSTISNYRIIFSGKLIFSQVIFFKIEFLSPLHPSSFVLFSPKNKIRVRRRIK